MAFANFRYSSSFVNESPEQEPPESLRNKTGRRDGVASRSQAIHDLKDSIENLISKRNTPRQKGHFSTSMLSAKKTQRDSKPLQNESVSIVDQILKQLGKGQNIQSFQIMKNNGGVPKPPVIRLGEGKTHSNHERIAIAKAYQVKTSFIGSTDKGNGELFLKRENSSVDKKEKSKNPRPNTNRNHTRRSGKHSMSKKLEEQKGKIEESQVRKRLISPRETSERNREHKSREEPNDEVSSSKTIEEKSREKSLKRKEALNKKGGVSNNNTSGSESGFSAYRKTLRDSSCSSGMQPNGPLNQKKIGSQPFPAPIKQHPKSTKPPRSNNKASFASFSSANFLKKTNPKEREAALKKYSMLTEVDEYYKCRGATQKLSFLSFQEPGFQKNIELASAGSTGSKKNDESICSSSNSGDRSNGPLVPEKQRSMKIITGDRLRNEENYKLSVPKPKTMLSLSNGDQENQGRCSPVAEVECEKEEEESGNQGFSASPQNLKATHSTLPPTTAGESSSTRFSLCASQIESAKRGEQLSRKLQEDLKRIKEEIRQRKGNSIETMSFLATLKQKKEPESLSLFKSTHLHLCDKIRIRKERLT